MAGTNKYGNVIDLSVDKILKAPRGAVKTFDPDLVDFIKTVTATHAVALTFFVVKRSDFATDEAHQNEKQRIGAMLRSHAREAGIGNISINWHPEGDYPQVSLKG